MTDEIFWAIARSTGTVALVLLSLSVALGIATRRAKPLFGMPRFAVQNVHRSISLFSLIFTVLHVVTLLLDKYAQLNVAALFIPFISENSPFWNGLGAIAFDLLLALAFTGIFRSLFSAKVFHLVHWGAYACWPIALAHGLGGGSDASEPWYLLLNAVCVLLVGASVAYRFLIPTDADKKAPALPASRAS